ncbi:MAG: Histidine kinase [Candidatus Tokpelaia sp. JSC188]|nr:MAG: Histidine kinase [Candidatus Tokpelaia sp. JSC188]
MFGSRTVLWQFVSTCLVLIDGGLICLASHHLLGEQLVIIILSGCAAIGIFFLLCSAFGICRFVLDDPHTMHATHILNQLPDAIAFTSEAGRMLYTNSAYRHLSGTKVLPLEALFSADKKISKAIYRLNMAAKEGRIASCKIKQPNNLIAQDKRRQRKGKFIYSMTVKPFEISGNRMLIWIISDLTEEHKREEIFISNIENKKAIPKQIATQGEACKAKEKRDVGNRKKAGEIKFYVMNPISCRTRCTLSLLQAGFLKDTMIESAFTLNKSISAKQSKIWFDDYFDISPIALAIIDHNRVVERANSRFLMLFKLKESSTRNNLNFIFSLELQDQKRVKEAIQQIFVDRSIIIPPIDAALIGEKKRYVRLYISSVIRNGMGSCIISVIEITEQRALEQQMEQSQKMQAVGQLAGGIAHDFNNVLTAIIMSCDLLLCNHRSSDPSHPDIMNIKNNANRAASLVRQLLAFSRRQTLRPEILDMTDILADLRMLFIRLIGNSIQLHIEHGRSLWSIKADQAELERAIMNLVINARDAMPQGGKLTIRTANITEQESLWLGYKDFQVGNYVLIEISDTGTGIAEDVLGKIFDPFFTTKDVGKGTGLGLSMVYGIVTQTGGHIYCDSELGKGTVFRIYLPHHIQDQDNAHKEKEQKKNRKADDNQSVDLSGSANVLLVEDEDSVRIGGVKALQSRGYTVFAAASGLEAWRIIKERKGKVDIVISDVIMPEMDGPTLFKKLRARFPAIKFIFVSGYAQDAFSRNLPEEAAFAFLVKPFSLKQLAETVKKMLNGKIP